MSYAETHKLLADWGKGKSSVRMCSQLLSGFFIFTALHWGPADHGPGLPLRNKKKILNMLSVSGLPTMMVRGS